MSWTIALMYLGQLFALLVHYGPEAPDILAKVSAFLAARDYRGLIKYIAGLIAQLPADAPQKDALQHVHDGLKSALGVAA